MKLISSLLLSAMLILAFTLTSCNEEPITPISPAGKNLNKFILPAGATLVSATFFVHPNESQIDANLVRVHNITSPWDEMTVTFNSFANAFDPTVVNTFTPVDYTWASVDVTSLVAGWLDGTITNYGLLIKEVPTDPGYTLVRSGYHSSENLVSPDFTPYLNICYTLNGQQYCDTTRTIADTYVWIVQPDLNYGDWNLLQTGTTNVNIESKYSLLLFDFEQTPPQVECETAYAYGDDAGVFAQCFIGLPGVQANNWGWSNKILNVSVNQSYEWPIYAGAAGCTGGTLVGTLYVDYNAATDCVTIEYEIDPDYELGEFHLWVDETNLLPRKPNGNYITAPGQFNHNGEPNPTTICGLDQPFWIAAHFGVCHEVVQ